MAGSSLIGSLAVDLTMETAAFLKGASTAEKELQTFSAKFTSWGKNIAGAGAIATAGITAPLVGLVSQAIPAAVESQQALAQVTSALESMGPKAGRSAEQLQAFAGHLQDLSNFDDDDILKSVTANLLTFGNVSGTVFDQAQQAAVDMSARLGQDLQSSAIQLGKALNDPIKGVTALQKVGVSFTAQQKEQIKAMAEAGNVAGAQSMILAELQKQFGGAAAAQRAATPDADMQQQWRSFNETLGAFALEVLPPLTAFLTDLLKAFNELDPATQKIVVGGAALAAAFGPIAIGVGGVVTAFGALLPLVAKLGPALTLLQAGFTAARVAAIAALPALGPFLVPLAAIAAAVAGVYLAWKNWDKIAPILRALYSGVKTWIMDKLGAVFDWLKGKLEAVGKWFFNLYDAVVGHSYVPDMVDEIGQHMARLDDNMVTPAKVATAKAGEAFEALRGKVKGLFDELFPEKAAFNAFDSDMAALDGAGKFGFSPEEIAEAKRRRREKLADEMVGPEQPAIIDKPLVDDNAIDKSLDDWAEAMRTKLVAPAKMGTAQVVESFASMATGVLQALDTLIGSIKRGDVVGIVGGILNAIGTVAGAVGGFNLGPLRFPGNTGQPGGPMASRSLSSSGALAPSPVNFDLRGAVMTQDLLKQMNTIGDVAAQRGSSMALSTIAVQRRTQLA